VPPDGESVAVSAVVGEAVSVPTPLGVDVGEAESIAVGDVGSTGVVVAVGVGDDVPLATPVGV